MKLVFLFFVGFLILLVLCNFLIVSGLCLVLLFLFSCICLVGFFRNENLWVRIVVIGVVIDSLRFWCVGFKIRFF